MPAANWLLAKAIGKLLADAHHFAGRFHLRPEHDVDAGELGEGEDGLLDRERGCGIGSLDVALLGQRHADHHLGRRLGQRHAGGLRDERHRAAGPRIDLEHVDVRPAVLALHGVLDVHQAR